MNIGFIGGGAMAEAITKGLVSSGIVDAKNLYLSDHKQARADYLTDTYGVNGLVGSETFINNVDVLFLAVKPQVVNKAIEEAAGKIKPDTLVVSIVAGLTLEVLEKYFATQPVIRVMPNTPMAVGEGMSAFAAGKNVTSEQIQLVEKLLSASGKAVEVKEYMMDAVTGLSGSGPAYGFLIIDAMSDGGVAAGLPRATARMLAAQTMLGAAKMVLESGKHPDELRDQVTSPAGTTIAGVRLMEEKGVRGAMIDAVLAAYEVSASMGKK